MTPFRRLWIAQTVSAMGDFLAVFAVQAAVVFRMHGSARDMAGVFVASLIPGIILGPLAGVFADRWDPRHTMIAADLARGGLILLLMRAVSLPQIYAISFAVSCCSSFFTPAQTIAIPLLIPRAGLLAANARMQQSMQLVRPAGPALASAVVAGCGERLCYGADSASFFSRRQYSPLCATHGRGARRRRFMCPRICARAPAFCSPIPDALSRRLPSQWVRLRPDVSARWRQYTCAIYCTGDPPRWA